MASDEDEDRISALHHILSFLPSDAAVQTCVLARRWRHLWRSTRSMRLSPCGRGGRGWTAPLLANFVNHFLLLRGATVPVNECDILCSELAHGYQGVYQELSSNYKHKLDDELNRTACLWIRHALPNSHLLRVHFRARRRLCLDGVPFASQRLTRIELTDATFKDTTRPIDFSGCPALEDLTMSSCKIYGESICSRTLARLTMANCYFHWETRTRISAPRLVSLQLSVCEGKPPLLEKMPLLEAASVTLEGFFSDTCDHNICHHNISAQGKDDTCYCYCINGKRTGVYLERMASCDRCYGCDDGSSVLLQGLSDAMDLELTSNPRVFTFRKDCKSRTTFSKLKTLLLNEWCMTVDFSALMYFLECSPVLEKLTLQLGDCETRYPVVKTDESYNPKEQLLFVSKHLKQVVIRCPQENELVEKLLLLLMTNGVPGEQIQIEQNFYPPDLSGYETNSSYNDDEPW